MVRRATVRRFAQCAGCENSRNAVHTYRVTVGSDTPRLLFRGVSAFSPTRIFLFRPATSSFGVSRRAVHPVASETPK